MRERNSDLDVDGERHDEQSDHDVGDGQRHDEEVGGRVKTALREDGQTDERIAEQRHNRQEQQTQRPVATLGPPVYMHDTQTRRYTQGEATSQ